MRSRDRISLTLGGLALLVSVLVIGGALRWTQAVVALLVAAALVIQLGSRRRLDHVSPIVVLLGLAIALTAIQLVPLPAGLLDAVTPQGNELRNDGAALAGVAPWQAISLDPAGTLRQLAFLVILLGVAVLGLRVTSSERGRYLVLGGVCVTAGLAAAVTGVHSLLNAEQLFGVYGPRHATPALLGPLLNSNHLGGLMALGAGVALGLIFYQRQAVQVRVLWVVIAIGCSATAMASLSRGATLALGLGLATTLALLIASRFGAASQDARGPRRALVNDVPITVVIAFGLAVAVYVSAGKVADQLDNTSLAELGKPLSKYAAWKSSLALVEDAPWVGIGRGALEPVFTRVHEPSAFITFSHLENEYIQAVVEWGIPGAIALGLALAWCIVTAVKRWRDGPLAAGALGACAAILFQSSVDFGIELLGLAVPVVLLATSLLGGRLRTSGGTAPGAHRDPVKDPPRFGPAATAAPADLHPLGATSSRRRGGGPSAPAAAVDLRASSAARITAARGGLIAALGCAALVLVLPITRSLNDDHDWLAEHRNATFAELQELIARHPLDYLVYGETAAFLFRTGDPRAVKFLNHALRLHPTHPGLHRLAARMLVASGRRAQGALEYSLALRGSLPGKTLIGEIVRQLPEVELAATAIPVDAPNRRWILRALAELGRNDVAVRWLQRVAAGPRSDLAVVDELYALALARHDLAAAETAARRRLAMSRTNTSRLLLARVMFRQEKFDQVIKDLADVPRWKGRTDETTEAWLLVCDAHLEKRAWDPALECLRKLDGSGVIGLARRSEVVKRLTLVNEHRTREAKQKAIEEMQRALGSPPKSP